MRTSAELRLRVSYRHRGALAILALCILALALCSSAQAIGGNAVGWGGNYDGEVGNGTTTTTGCQCIEAPVPVSAFSDATQISAGRFHTLGLLSGGTVASWGFNSKGELGVGSEANSSTPVPVPGLTNVVAIAAGAEHSLALLSNGTVMAWGDNENGELGIGETSGPESCAGHGCAKTPIPVPGLANVVAIDADYHYSLALLADGTVMAWGYDEFGQLGDGTGVQGGCMCVDQPHPVPGVSAAMAIAAGGELGEALLADGTVKAWGSDQYGELGNGMTTNGGPCACLGPVSVSGLSGAKAVAAGALHGMALGADSGVKIWGDGEYQQLGFGPSGGPETCNTVQCSKFPLSVSGASPALGIDAGGYHSLALLSNGEVSSWGSNSYAQLGVGDDGSHDLPIQIAGLNDASEISASEYNGFALVGPSQNLTISLVGAGSGAVGTQGTLCPPACTGRYPQGQVKILRAEGTAGSGFAGFSGACTGVVPCQVTLSQDQTVTATFGVPKGTGISEARINSRKGSAKFAFSAPGAITGYQCLLLRAKPKRGQRAKLSKKSKQRKPRFLNCAGTRAYRHLRRGHYTFKVRALDIIGADPVPASRAFLIRSGSGRPTRGA